jgi:hypothetical protein
MEWTYSVYYLLNILDGMITSDENSRWSEYSQQKYSMEW